MNGLDATSAQFAIHSAMLKEFEGVKLFVNCNSLTESVDENQQKQLQQSLPKFMKFISNGEAYCSHGNGRLWCTIVALLA